MLGVLLTGIVWGLTPLLCRMVNLVGAAQPMGIVYLRTFACSITALGVLFVSAACLRSAGDTRSPFFVLALVNVVNIACSLLFVFGPAPWGGRGVMGIALGTAVGVDRGSRDVRCALQADVASCVCSGIAYVREPAMLRRILRISGPQFFDSVAMWSGNFLLVAVVGYLGRSHPDGCPGGSHRGDPD